MTNRSETMTIAGTVYGWTAVRSGTGMTITHTTGRLTGISGISVLNGRVIATTGAGVPYELSTLSPGA